MLVVRLKAAREVGHEAVHDEGKVELERHGQRGGLEYGMRPWEQHILIPSSPSTLPVDFHAANLFVRFGLFLLLLAAGGAGRCC